MPGPARMEFMDSRAPERCWRLLRVRGPSSITCIQFVPFHSRNIKVDMVEESVVYHKGVRLCLRSIKAQFHCSPAIKAPAHQPMFSYRHEGFLRMRRGWICARASLTLGSDKSFQEGECFREGGSNPLCPPVLAQRIVAGWLETSTALGKIHAVCFDFTFHSSFDIIVTL